MRTTLNIADDVLYAVKARARREKKSAGEVLSELARQALTGRRSSAESATSESFFGFSPLKSRGKAVSNELIDRLRDEEHV